MYVNIDAEVLAMAMTYKVLFQHDRMGPICAIMFVSHQRVY